MSRDTAEAAAIILTLGILASPVRAEAIKLTDAQMDEVTAGFFMVGLDPNMPDPNILSGLLNGQPVTLVSLNNGKTYISLADGTPWTTQVLLISTTQGYADGVLIGPQGQNWNGEITLPGTFVLVPDITLAGSGRIPIAAAPIRMSTRTSGR